MLRGFILAAIDAGMPGRFADDASLLVTFVAFDQVRDGPADVEESIAGKIGAVHRIRCGWLDHLDPVNLCKSGVQVVDELKGDFGTALKTFAIC